MSDAVIDVERARRETRGCTELIHFNNAGAALMPVPVVDAVVDYLRQEERQGGYELMDRRAAELARFYPAAAVLLKCSAEEIAFVDSATRGWSLAFYSFDFQPGDRILIGRAEYGSNLVGLLHLAQKKGIKIEVVPDDETGRIDPAALENLLDNNVKLIALTHAPSGNGLINPAAAVGQVARKYQIPYLLDACQSLGQLPVDVGEIGCDILCGTGRKFLRGPRGTGLLYVRKELLETLEPPLLNHHSADLLSVDEFRIRPDAKRFECWERSYAGQLGLTAAIDYALGWGLDAIAARIDLLATKLREELAEIDGITVTDLGDKQSGIVTFAAERLSATELQAQLARQRINLSVVPYSANPLMIAADQRLERLRASVHYYNNDAEVERFIEVLMRLLAG